VRAIIVKNDYTQRNAAGVYPGPVVHLRNTRLRDRGYVYGRLGVRREPELEVSRQHVRLVAVYLWSIDAADREALSVAERPGAVAGACVDIYGMDVLLGVLHRIRSTSFQRLPVGLYAVRRRLHGSCDARVRAAVVYWRYCRRADCHQEHAQTVLGSNR